MRQLVSNDPAELSMPLAPDLTKDQARHAGAAGWSWRKADKFLLFILGNLLLLGLMFAHAAVKTEANLPFIQAEGKIVNWWGLTDLCLSTEAAYTRHLSQSDGHAPFQTHPLALEHFPTGAILLPRK